MNKETIATLIYELLFPTEKWEGLSQHDKDIVLNVAGEVIKAQEADKPKIENRCFLGGAIITNVYYDDTGNISSLQVKDEYNTRGYINLKGDDGYKCMVVELKDNLDR